MNLRLLDFRWCKSCSHVSKLVSGNFFFFFHIVNFLTCRVHCHSQWNYYQLQRSEEIPGKPSCSKIPKVDVISPFDTTINSLSISVGEQRLWVWVRDWHRDHCQVGEVHVWQQGKWWHQLCYTSWACYPAAGMDLLMHSDTSVIIRRWVKPVCLIPTFQEGAFALVFKSVHYPGEAVGTR